eukprot:gene4243-5312_t
MMVKGIIVVQAVLFSLLFLSLFKTISSSNPYAYNHLIDSEFNGDGHHHYNQYQQVYKKGNHQANGVINAFLIPHSHCDVGWLQTYNQYYMENVTLILNNVINTLSNDPSKKFSWAEIVYFERWYNQQSAIVQNQVRQLVDNKQLEFVGGGWAQNDEAVTHYEAVINQMTLGHQFLLKEFGVRPEISWQIDPFGPSTVTATLFKLMGFKYHIINRLDERIKYNFSMVPGSGIMTTDQDFEFVWYPSPNYGPDLSIFTHVLDHHYSPPSLCYPNATNPNITICTGFDFEGDPNVNPPINSTNIQERAEILVEIIQQRQSLFRHNNVLLPFGNDFRYQNAHIEFSNMDTLIEYINANQSFGINIKYAVLSEYFDTLFQELDNSTSIFPKLANQDYFTYTQCLAVDLQKYNTCVNYWSGYFSSYPQLKKMARDSDTLLRTAEMIYSLSSAFNNGFQFDFDPTYEALKLHRNVSGILTHHDAITGTAKEYVRADYTNMLYTAQNETLKAISPVIGFLLANRSIPLNFTYDSTVLNSLHDGDVVAVSFTNNLAWQRVEYVHIPIKNQYLAVYDFSGSPVQSQVVERLDKGGQWYLYFEVETPALGISTYFVVALSDSRDLGSDLLSIDGLPSPIPSYFSDTIQYSDEEVTDQSFSATIGNNLFNLNFKASSTNKGLVELVSYDDLSRNQMGIPLLQQLIEYPAMSDDAYKFRPANYPTPFQAETPQFYMTQGPLLQMVTVIYSNNVSQAFIVYNSTNIVPENPLIQENQFFEIESKVAVAWDREISMRFNTSIKSDYVFYTNNGIEMMERMFQQKYNDSHIWSLIAGNFYPMINTGYITDGNNQLTLLTQQSVGASSQENGVFELLLIRRCNYTQWSIHETLNDTSNPFVKVRVLFGAESNIQLQRTPHSLLHENKLLQTYSPLDYMSIEKWMNLYNTQFNPLSNSFPPNIHLMSFNKQDKYSPSTIMRAMNIYEMGQNSDFSRPSTVSISNSFNIYNISNIYQTTLTANDIVLNDTTPSGYNGEENDQDNIETVPLIIGSTPNGNNETFGINYEKRSSGSSIVDRLPLFALYFNVSLSVLSTLEFGYNTGVISPTIVDIKALFHLDVSKQSALVSIVLVGAMIGSFLSGFSVDFIGRKKTLIFNNFLYMLGPLLSAVAQNYATIFVGRIISGIAVGIASAVVPLYITEISPPPKRGALGLLRQSSITLGIMVSSLVAYGFMKVTNGWRYTIAISAAPSFLQLALCYWFVETPRWLISKNKIQEAQIVMEKLEPTRSSQQIMNDIQKIKNNIVEQEGNDGWLQLFHNTIILEDAGFVKHTAVLLSALVGIPQLIMLFISVWLIDRFGRRPLLIVGLIGMIVGLGVLGYSFWGVTGSTGNIEDASRGWVAVAGMVFFKLCFSLGLGPLPALIASEIFPSKIRGKAMAISQLLNWLANFIANISFLHLLAQIGQSGTYWLFGGVSFICLVFVFFLVPETKGIPIEELSKKLLLKE